MNRRSQEPELTLRRLVQSGRVPGLQYVAVDAASTLVDYCGGFAELGRRPLTPATTLMAYSMSKTVTAVAVLQLIERGRLGIDDPIAKFLPWQPYGDEITVRQLLSHTAGVPNPMPLRWVHPADARARFDEHEALVAVLRRHSRRAAPPGARFAYSNIGYWLLGALLEKITGQSMAAQIALQVFTPLGLTSRDMAYVIADPARHASGYLERGSLVNLLKPFLIDRRLLGECRGRWQELLPHYVNGPAFGGIVARAAGFGCFLQDQLRDESCLLGQRARRLLFEQQRTHRADIRMTLGWHIGSLGTQRYYFKEGGGGGFHCMMRLYDGQGIGTVLMTNATTFSVAKALDEVDARLWAA